MIRPTPERVAEMHRFVSHLNDGKYVNTSVLPDMVRDAVAEINWLTAHVVALTPVVPAKPTRNHDLPAVAICTAVLGVGIGLAALVWWLLRG